MSLWYNHWGFSGPMEHFSRSLRLLKKMKQHAQDFICYPVLFLHRLLFSQILPFVSSSSYTISVKLKFLNDSAFQSHLKRKSIHTQLPFFLVVFKEIGSISLLKNLSQIDLFLFFWGGGRKLNLIYFENQTTRKIYHSLETANRQQYHFKY